MRPPEKIIFDAVTDNHGKGVTATELIGMIKQINAENPQRNSSLRETAYLLSSKKNRTHLKKSLREAKIGKTRRVR